MVTASGPDGGRRGIVWLLAAVLAPSVHQSARAREWNRAVMLRVASARSAAAPEPPAAGAGCGIGDECGADGGCGADGERFSSAETEPAAVRVEAAEPAPDGIPLPHLRWVEIGGAVVTLADLEPIDVDQAAEAARRVRDLRAGTPRRDA